MLISSARAYIRAVASERVIASVIAETIPASKSNRAAWQQHTQHAWHRCAAQRAAERRAHGVPPHGKDGGGRSGNRPKWD